MGVEVGGLLERLKLLRFEAVEGKVSRQKAQAAAEQVNVRDEVGACLELFPGVAE